MKLVACGQNSRMSRCTPWPELVSKLPSAICRLRPRSAILATSQFLSCSSTLGDLRSMCTICRAKQREGSRSTSVQLPTDLCTQFHGSITSRSAAAQHVAYAVQASGICSSAVLVAVYSEMGLATLW